MTESLTVKGKNECKVWQISSCYALSSLPPLSLHPNGETHTTLHPTFLLFFSSPFLFPFFPFSSHLHLLLRAVPSLCPPGSSAPPPPLRSPLLPTRSLWVNRSPLARALLWSRPPSSCFLNPPAEWVSDWPTQRDTGERSRKRRWLFFFFFFYNSLYLCMHGVMSRCKAVRRRHSTWLSVKLTARVALDGCSGRNAQHQLFSSSLTFWEVRLLIICVALLTGLI